MSTRLSIVLLIIAALVASPPVSAQPQPPMRTMAKADPQTGLYGLHWISAIPIDVATIEVDVSGNGIFLGVTSIGNGEEGYVWAAAPSACLGITMRAQTTTGVAVVAHTQWHADCPRTFLPLVAR